jgi:hypothetical protein
MSIWKARLSSLAAGMAAVVIFSWAPLPSAHGGDGTIKEGDPAPSVELPATQVEKVLPDQPNAKTLRLADLQGKKNVVLYFFPKAMTPG